MRSAETVVEEQVSAYNEHDLERFVETYAADVEIVGRHGHVLRGHEALRRTTVLSSRWVKFAPRYWADCLAGTGSSTMNGNQ